MESIFCRLSKTTERSWELEAEAMSPGSKSFLGMVDSLICETTLHCEETSSSDDILGDVMMWKGTIEHFTRTRRDVRNEQLRHYEDNG